MVNYEKSIIYKLCCMDPTIKDVYIGSTTAFRKRKHQHKANCTKKTCRGYTYPVYQFIRANGGWNNWDMVEVEQYCAVDKNALHSRERFWLEKLCTTLNKVVPTRSKAEYRQNNKEKITERGAEYYQNNKEIIDKKNAEYYQNNKEKIAKRAAEFRQNNKEEIAKKVAEYYQKNKEKITGKNAEKVECECGSVVTRGCLTRHRKTKKHQRIIENMS